MIRNNISSSLHGRRLGDSRLWLFDHLLSRYSSGSRSVDFAMALNHWCRQLYLLNWLNRLGDNLRSGNHMSNWKSYWLSSDDLIDNRSWGDNLDPLALRSKSGDFSISLGNSPLDSVVLHDEKSNLCLGLGDQVTKGRVKLVDLNNWSSGWSKNLLLNLLDNLNWLFNVLHWTRDDSNTGSVFRSVELVGLNLGAGTVQLTGSDTRGVEVVSVALAKTWLESLRLVECHLILILLKYN